MIIKTASLMIFAFGIAIVAKYIGFQDWVEANTWIGIPMIVVGSAGIVFIFGNRR